MPRMMFLQFVFVYLILINLNIKNIILGTNLYNSVARCVQPLVDSQSLAVHSFSITPEMGKKKEM